MMCDEVQSHISLGPRLNLLPFRKDPLGDSHAEINIGFEVTYPSGRTERGAFIRMFSFSLAEEIASDTFQLQNLIIRRCTEAEFDVRRRINLAIKGYLSKQNHRCRPIQSIKFYEKR